MYMTLPFGRKLRPYAQEQENLAAAHAAEEVLRNSIIAGKRRLDSLNAQIGQLSEIDPADIPDPPERSSGVVKGDPNSKLNGLLLERRKLRARIAALEAEDREAEARWHAENDARLAAEADRQLEAEFDAEEAAAKAERFKRWKANRRTADQGSRTRAA